MAERPGPTVLIAYEPADQSFVDDVARLLAAEGLDVRTFAAAGRPSKRAGVPTGDVVAADVIAIAAGPGADEGALLSVAKVVLSQRGPRPAPFVTMVLAGGDESMVRSLGSTIGAVDTFDLRQASDRPGVASDAAARLRRVAEAFPVEGPAESGPKPEPGPPPATEEAARSADADAGETPAPEEPSPGLLDTIYLHLSDGAKRALAEADRLSPDNIHMEHLIAGLYRWRDGRTRSALNEAGIGDSALASLLGLSETEIGPPTSADAIAPIDHLPDLTTHALEALIHGAEAALGPSGEQGEIRARHVFFGALQVKGCTPIERILEAGRLDPATVLVDPAPASAQGTAVGAPIAGFRSDEATGPDLLGIGDEVEALATVIAAQTVEPPLALGLFGDWGTGKTFFMNKLEARITEIADREKAAKRPEPVYCKHIVQLTFNAWHYIEQDLWASLASSIFDGLDEWIAKSEHPGEDRDATMRASLLTQEARKKDKLEEFEQTKTEANEAASRAERSLEELDGKYAQVNAGVPTASVAQAIVDLASDQPEVKKVADQLREAIANGAKQATKGSTDAEADAVVADLEKSNLAGLRTAIGQWLSWRNDVRIWGPIAIAVLIAIGFFSFVAGRTDIAPLVRTGGGLVSAALVVIAPIFWPLQRILRVIWEARVRSQKLIEEARQKQRAPIVAEREAANALALKAEADATAMRKELQELRSDIEKAEPSREMATFIQRRQASADYRRRLGTVAKARDDFEQLTRLLAKQQSAPAATSGADAAAPATDTTPPDTSPPHATTPAATAPDANSVASASDAAATPAAETAVAPEPSPDAPTPEPGEGKGLFTPIDRIVLYIDDLDRCREKDVVAVLQAVHLLLAFRLFVVVVAVDPRWLLHSLRVTTRALEDDETGWDATPMNYLEKIFQVPYALRPMGPAGFAAMIDSLVPATTHGSRTGATGDGADGSATRPVAAMPDAGGGNGTGLASATVPAAGSAAGPTIDAEPGPEPGSVPPTPGTGAADQPTPSGAAHGEAPAPVREVDMNPRSLDIGDDERTFMAELSDLIGTPRAAKRFVNVYRLLKASRPPTDIAMFADPAHHRPILVLLAVLTGFPAEATTILRELLDDEPVGSWLVFVRGMAEPTRLVQLAPAAIAGRPPEYEPKKDVPKDDRIAAQRWARLLGKLEQLEVRVGPLEASHFWPWALPVARYGFEASRLLANEATPQQQPAPVPVTRTPPPA